MTSVLFSVWFKIQRTIKKWLAYYSASGSGLSIWLKMTSVLFSVWFRIQRTTEWSASGSGFSVRLGNDQRIIQRLVQGSAYDWEMTSVLFSVWLRIKRTIKKWPVYYSASGSGFSVLLKMTRVLFSVWFRIQCTIKIKDNIWFSIWFRIQRTIQNWPAYYSASGPGLRVRLKMTSVRFSVWFRIQRKFQNWLAYDSVSATRFGVRGSCKKFCH